MFVTRVAVGCSVDAAGEGRGPLDAQSSSGPGLALAERLRFPPSSRLVMVHADDSGGTHSVDQGELRAQIERALQFEVPVTHLDT